MENNLANNPFSALFGSVSDAQRTQTTENDANNPEQPGNSLAGEGNTQATSVSSDDIEINNIVENVFSITLNQNNNSSRPLVYLEELGSAMAPKVVIDMATFEQALFERLLLENPRKHVIPVKSKSSHSDSALSDEVILYLFFCYGKLQDLKKAKPEKEFLCTMDSLVVRNAATALSQPDLYAGQKLDEQVIGLFRQEEYTSHAVSFLTAIAELISTDEGPEVSSRAFAGALDYLKRCIGSQPLLMVDMTYLRILEVWSSSSVLGEFLNKYDEKKIKRLPNTLDNS